MAHKWKSIGGTKQYPFRTIRQCENCGVIQERNSVTSWMRTIGYKWEPLAGRCPSKEEVIKESKELIG